MSGSPSSDQASAPSAVVAEPRAVPTPGRRRRLAALALAGVLAGFLLGEQALRAAAPFAGLSLRAFVEEEARQHAISALRAARRSQIILHEADFARHQDVVAIGDSLTWGTLVSDEDVWTSHLADRTGRTVLNLGVPGAAPCVYNHMLRLALDRLTTPPALVLYTIFANDVPGLPCRPIRDDELFVWEREYRASPRLRLRMAREWLFQRSVLYQLGKRLLTARSLNQKYHPVPYVDGDLAFLFAPVPFWRTLLDPKDPLVAQGLRDLGPKLEATRAATAAAGARLVVVLIPSREQVYVPALVARGALPPETYDRFYDDTYDAILASARSLGLASVDLRRPLREAATGRAKLYWTLDGHLTPAGHRLVASTLTPIVSELIAGPARARHDRP